MLSPTTLLNTLTLKVLLNLKSCQINEDKIFIDKSDVDKNNNLDKILSKLGFNEIIVGSDNNLDIITTNNRNQSNNRPKKRGREEETDYFHCQKWISPSRIRNYLEEPFVSLLTEVPSLKPFEEPENEMMNLYFIRNSNMSLGSLINDALQNIESSMKIVRIFFHKKGGLFLY